MTWYPLMQAVISAGADHLTCSKLLKLDDMRLTYLRHLDVIFSLLIEGRGIDRVWRGDFADWVDSSCTNHLFRLDELALGRILKTFWEMTSR